MSVLKSQCSISIIMKKRCIPLFALILLLLLSACSQPVKTQPSNGQPQATDLLQPTTGVPTSDINEKKVMINIYFADSENSAVIPEKREVAVKDGAILKAAVMAILEGPRDKNLRKTIPEGTILNSINLKGDVAVVDFSKSFTQAGGVAEIVERASLVNTLTDIAGVKKVKILVDGKSLVGPSGMPIGELTRVALDEDGLPVPGELKIVTIYFGNSNADAVIPEKRQVTVNAGEPLEAVIFRELQEGPETKGLFEIIPRGTKLLDISTSDGTCTLNLSKEFVDNHNGGTAGESMTINSIVNSLTEIPQIKKVKFLIEGDVREAYIHSVFSEPFERNASIIKQS